MKAVVFVGVFSVFAACAPVDDAGSDAGPADAATQQDAGNGLLCEVQQPECSDEMIQQISLQDFVSTGAVSGSESGGVFTTEIDASAGGMQGATSNPFVYIKFTPDGAVKVEIDDEASLDSQDWDLAARRTFARLNSGDSGPSCVLGAEVSGDFDAVTTAPASFSEEDFFSDSCDYVVDSRFSGFDGPDSLLKTFWEMSESGMGVDMTGQVYVLQLADGSHLKLVFDAYNNGHLTIRWAWL